MKRRQLRVVLAGLVLLAVYTLPWIWMAAPPASVWAAESPLLADKHKSAGIPCEGCHTESPPKEKVLTAKCMSCHGDYAKLAERTQKAEKNPHESHVGELECTQCHNAHKPSVDYCGVCHNFGFKVP